MDDFPPSYIERKPRGMSCFAKGCVFIAAILALLVVLLIGGCVYFQRSFGSFVGDHQVALRESATTNEQYQIAMRKLQPLLGMETPGQPLPASIEITADDLNALVAHDPRLADERGKCFFAIPGNQLAVDLSMEAPQNTTRQSQTVYFNARVTGDVEIADGAIRLSPHKIESLSGTPFPDWMMNNFIFHGFVDQANKDINRDIHNNTDLTDAVAKIRSARIENGRLILTLAAANGKPPAGASPVALPSP